MEESFLQIARESQKEMLQTAYNCFLKASECCDEDSEEEWLHNYMTGKCLEKMGKPAKEYLSYYAKVRLSILPAHTTYPISRPIIPAIFCFKSIVCLFCCFTSQVNSYGHGGTVSSPSYTFSWASLNKQLTSTSCTYFPL